MKTLGIDPGTAIMGFGVVEESGNKLKAIDFGCLKTTKELSPAERLLKLHSMLNELFREFKPDHLATEKLFFSSNTKTAISIGEARGIVLLSAASHGVKFAEYSPQQIKIAVTGYGKAEKKQVQHMVKALLKLKEIPRPDDAADALAIAICHINSYSLVNR